MSTGPATQVANAGYWDLAITVHHAQHGALTAAELGTYETPLTITIDNQQRYEPRLRPQASAGSTIGLLPVLSCRPEAAKFPCCFSSSYRQYSPYLYQSCLALADREHDCTIHTSFCRSL